MPTYSYECKKCKHAYDVFKPISEATSIEHCPCCEEVASKRLSKPCGFIFKGEGFYANDYKEK